MLTHSLRSGIILLYKYQAFYNAGLCELNLDDLKKAEEYFQSALKLKSDDYDIMYNLAYVQLLSKKIEESKNMFLQLYEKYPQDSDVLFNMGYIEDIEHNTKSAKSARKRKITRDFM